MSGLLRDMFRSEFRCRESDAALLAELTREKLPALTATSDDSEEDLVVRLRDPKAFGGLAELLVRDRRLAVPTRLALVEHAFDLLPLPRSEGDVILVGARAPSRLLALARFLAEHDALTVLHAMHLVYAVFLDRSLLRNVGPATRGRVLMDLLRLSESGERLQIVYAGLHLATVPEAESRADLRRILDAPDISPSMKSALASIVSGEEGGMPALARLAQDEGLLPSDLDDSRDPAILANIPRMPPALAPIARRWVHDA